MSDAGLGISERAVGIISADDVVVKSVIATLAYSEQFGFPLTTREIWLRLICLPRRSDRFLLSEVEDVLAKLCRKKIVEKQADFFVLDGIKKALDRRINGEALAEKKSAELEPFLAFAKFWPGIRAVALTGSVAVDNALPGDDLDLMIVVKSGWLWLTRLLSMVIAAILRRRVGGNARASVDEIIDIRSNGDINSISNIGAKFRTKSAGLSLTGLSMTKAEWCFNMWLATNELGLSEHQQGYYEAFEALQARWLLDKDSIEQRFLITNKWIGKLLPNWYGERAAKGVGKACADENSGGLLSQLLEAIVILPSNIACYLLQAGYRSLRYRENWPNYNLVFYHDSLAKILISHRWHQLVIKFMKKINVQEQLPLDLIQKLSQAQSRGKKVVLATGVFDLLHQEHSTFLQKARAVGDFLVVGLESDARVKKMKGEGRPINNEVKRLANVARLNLADAIFILPESFNSEDEHLSLLEKIRPNFLAVSSHTRFQKEKRALMAKIGGELVVVHEHNPEISSTIMAKSAIVNKLVEKGRDAK